MDVHIYTEPESLVSKLYAKANLQTIGVYTS